MHTAFGNFQTKRKESDQAVATGMVVNIPVQLISSCSTLGELTPLRFRYENEEHMLSTVNIDHVLSMKENQYNGITEIIYTCQAYLDKTMHLFELKYTVTSHRWMIFRILT